MDEIGTGKMGDTRFKTSNHCSQTICKHRVIEACDSINCRDAINRVFTNRGSQHIITMHACYQMNVIRHYHP